MVKRGFKVTPWDVEGNIDYDRLVKQFGVSKIDRRLLKRIREKTGELHFMLRRKVFFAHRDLDWLLNKHDERKKFFLYTGRASSNEGVHIGHLVPWVFTKWLQDKFNAELWFQFPDEEKFLFKRNVSLKDTERGTYNDGLDIIALGFNPNLTNFLIDTKHASIMYSEACKVAKKINLSTAKAVFGFDDRTNIGSIFYTAMQAVPAFLPSVLKGRNIPCLIPLGVDQDPHFRVSRDVMHRLGFFKPAIIHAKFLPGLTEGGKMSASNPSSTIYTTDTEQKVEEKIKRAFSGGQINLKEHRKKGGIPEIDASYKWLEMFFEPNDNRLIKIYNDYKSGKLLTSELKAMLIEKVNKFLKQHQEKREKAENIYEKFLFQP